MARCAVLAALAAVALLVGAANAASVDLCGDIEVDMTLFAVDDVELTCQTFVKSGATLTIEGGTTIKAVEVAEGFDAPALVIERGAKIMAEGTADDPITFTTADSSLDPDAEDFSAEKAWGKWGGLIILGSAPLTLAEGDENSVEGLPQGKGLYGGDDPDDNSGVLKYVRVWYGGSVIGENNEINGITFAGVGAGTTVENIEVAYNLDDGIEFFGGTVNAKYLSVLFCGDDAIDTDEGYSGKIQFVFIVLGRGGHHAFEMDSILDGGDAVTPRSFPQVYNVLIVGGSSEVDAPSSDDQLSGLMRFREGTAGSFGNIVMVNVGEHGVRMNDCAEVLISQDGDDVGPNTLWFSANNIIAAVDEPFNLDDGCEGLESRSEAAPGLTMVGSVIDENVAFIDPRPVSRGSAVFNSVDELPDDEFWTPVDFRGAFDEDLWISGWSFLDDFARIPDNIPGKILDGDVEADTTWSADTVYLLTDQVFVKDGATLTIQAGTTIFAYSDNGAGKAPALVVERGGQIMAEGNADAPITFTSALNARHLPRRGTWGGLIINGNAPISTEGGSNEVEGLEGVPYGGSDPTDNSGILQYVRVWYGGEAIAADNEINGITFAGVGSGTTVDHIEVAYNLDDGVEFFGGSVNVKYLSVLFCGDDGIDTDEGYSGKIQFAVVVVGEGGHHATEMDSDGSDPDAKPRSFPQIYNALFVGGSGNPASESSDDQREGLMRLREGTGGEFGNLILANVLSVGVLQNDCGREARTHILPAGGVPNYLWFSSNNLMAGEVEVPFVTEGCEGPRLRNATLVEDLGLVLLPSGLNEDTAFFDPRPTEDGPAYKAVDDVPSDGFFESVAYKGAFGREMWLAGWSWLSEAGRIPNDVWGPVLAEDVAQDTTWRSADTYLLTRQVFVKPNVTLTIEPGTTIMAYADDGEGKAPSLIVERGAQIIAKGSSSRPITFTAAAHPSLLPARGMWGGLIVLGSAPIIGGEREVEGIDGKKYGGSNVDDNSGVLSYVRVWYGGRVVGANNEINGITFAGVGRGTEVSHIEVAFNLDDGVEFFGGTVDAKYVSVLYCGDDGIDTDEGYQGRLQFVSVLVDSRGHHGAEMDSKLGSDSGDPQPRSFPRLYNALFVGSENSDPSPVSSDDTELAMMRLREATGGEFGNIVIVNAPVGVFQEQCGSEAITQDLDAARAIPDLGSNYLWFSANNVISGARRPFSVAQGCEGLGAADTTSDTLLQAIPVIVDNASRVDPRPRPDSPLTDLWDPVPDDGFFERADYRGAFSPDVGQFWLGGWSWLFDNGRLAFELSDSQLAALERQFPELQDQLGAEGGGASSGSSAAGVAGGAVAAVVALIAVAVGVIFYVRSRRFQKKYETLMEGRPDSSIPETEMAKGVAL
ncbi:unnamed protein product [Ostreobium quekettii]|uniref:Uncharacterized protein n=1 Tax=Ostreobium quekettii TaxID=121088 RepID=A0A8S1J104_9CHLO|nr:unnamed protein product [Ostreobium quekettii]